MGHDGPRLALLRERSSLAGDLYNKWHTKLMAAVKAGGLEAGLAAARELLGAKNLKMFFSGKPRPVFSRTAQLQPFCRLSGAVYVGCGAPRFSHRCSPSPHSSAGLTLVLPSLLSHAFVSGLPTGCDPMPWVDCCSHFVDRSLLTCQSLTHVTYITPFHFCHTQGHSTGWGSRTRPTPWVSGRL
jgi:hypothetical protein